MEGEASGELLVLIAQAGPVARPLVAYLGLFRSKSRALSFDRAARIAREVLELGADPRALGAALSETVEALRAKRDGGHIKPMSNHNYLKRVLESVQIPPASPPPFDKGGTGGIRPSGKRAQAIALLADWAGNDWLRIEIAQGLAALLADNRQGAPGADTVTLTAGLWETLLRSRNVDIEEVDAPRIKSAFQALLTGFEGWPEARELIARMPRRPERPKLGAGLTEDDREAGKIFFKGLSSRMD